MSDRKSTSHSSTQPHGKNGNLSQRGMLSLVMLFVSVGTFSIAGISGFKLIISILSDDPEKKISFVVLIAQVIVIGLAYIVGWVTAMLGIRVYGNLILPILIKWFTWGCLLAVCYLYIAILQRMYNQPEQVGKLFKYLIVMAAGLTALVGFHLIIEDHDLRPFSIPLLIISLGQLGMIVFRYVFDVDEVRPGFLWEDLLFFAAMITVSISMLAHWGILEPFRTRLTNYFDKNSVAIRTQD